MSPSRREFIGRSAALGLAPLVGDAGSLRREGPRPGRRRAGPSGEVSLAFVGDLFLLGGPAEAGRYGGEYPSELLGRADLAFANLENGLSTVGSPELGGFDYSSAIRGEPARARELPLMGIDAVSLANNHTGNFGREALLQTMDVLDGAGVRHAGGGRSRREAFSAAHLEAGGARVAFHSAYSLYQEYAATDRAGPETPGIAGCLAYDVVLTEGDGLAVERMRAEADPAYLVPREGPAPRAVLAPFREDLAHLERGIERSRERADVVVVSVHFHWGRHLRADVPIHQRSLTHAAVDAGADLVVGHGAHVLRGMEVYRGCPILYGLGNFLLSPADGGPSGEGRAPEDVPPDRRSVVLLYRAGPESWSVELAPLAIGRDGVPRRAGERVGGEILAELRGLSAAFESRVEWSEGAGSLRP